MKQKQKQNKCVICLVLVFEKYSGEKITSGEI